MSNIPVVIVSSRVAKELISCGLGALLRLREEAKTPRFALQSPSYDSQALALAFFVEECFQQRQRVLVLVPSQRHVLCELLDKKLKESSSSVIDIFHFFEGKKWPKGRVVITTWEKGFNLFQRRSRNQFSAVALVGLDEMLAAQNRSYLADVLLFLLTRKKRVVRALSICWTSPYWPNLVARLRSLDPSLLILDQWVNRASHNLVPASPGHIHLVLRKEVLHLQQTKKIQLKTPNYTTPDAFLSKLNSHFPGLEQTEVCIVTNRSRGDFPNDLVMNFRTFTEDLPSDARKVALDLASLTDHRKAALSCLTRYFPIPGVEVLLIADSFWGSILTRRNSDDQLGFWWDRIFNPRPYAKAGIDYVTVLRLFSQQRSISILEEYIKKSYLVARPPIFPSPLIRVRVQITEEIDGFRSHVDYRRDLEEAFRKLQTSGLLKSGHKTRVNLLGELLVRYNLPFEAYETLDERMKSFKRSNEPVSDKSLQAELLSKLCHNLASRVAKDQRGEFLRYEDIRSAFQQFLGVEGIIPESKPSSLSQVSWMFIPDILQAVNQHFFSAADPASQMLSFNVHVILNQIKALRAKAVQENPDRLRSTRYSGNPWGTKEQLVNALIQYKTDLEHPTSEATHFIPFLKVQDLITRLDVPRRTAHNYLYRIFERNHLEEDLDIFGKHQENIIDIRKQFEMEKRPLGRGRAALVIFPQTISNPEACRECTNRDSNSEACRDCIARVPDLVACKDCIARVPDMEQCSWVQRLNVADSEKFPFEYRGWLESIAANTPACRLFTPRRGPQYIQRLNYHDVSIFQPRKPLCPKCKAALATEPKPQRPVTCLSCGSVLSFVLKGPFRNQFKVEISEEKLLQAHAREMGLGRLPDPLQVDNEDLQLYIDATWDGQISNNELLLSHKGRTWTYPIQALASVYAEGKPKLIDQLRRRGVPWCYSRSIRSRRRKTRPRLREALQLEYPSAILAVPYSIRMLTSVMTTTRELHRIIPSSSTVHVTESACQHAYERQGRYIARQIAHGLLPTRTELRYFETGVRRPLVDMCRTIIHYAWDDRRVINPLRGRAMCRRLTSPFAGLQDFHRAWTMADAGLNTLYHIQRTFLRETLAQVGYGWNPGRLFNHEPRDKPGKGALLDLEEEPRLLAEVQLTRALSQKRFGPSHFAYQFTPHRLPYYYPNAKGFQSLRRFTHNELLQQPVRVAIGQPISFRQYPLGEACRRYAIVIRQQLNALVRDPCYRTYRKGQTSFSAEELTITGALFLGRHPALAVPFIPDRLWGKDAWERTLYDLPHFWCDLPQQLLDSTWLDESSCTQTIRFISTLKQSLKILQAQILGGETSDSFQGKNSVPTSVDIY